MLNFNKKTMNNFSLKILLIFVLSISCNKKEERINKTKSLDSISVRNKEKEKKIEEKRKEINKQKKKDSLSLDKVLKSALEKAKKYKNKNLFFEKYKVLADFCDVEVEINSNYHFNNTQSHLIIKRTSSGEINIDIYSKSKNEYKKVIQHNEWSLTYVNDTIRDINGDGLKDFIVNWYGATGWCLKGFSNVYLIRNDKQTFSKDFEFINPTFSPNEKIIRGICYGHPGETEIYKYRWDGEKIDTLEYLSFQKDKKGSKTGKFLLTTDQPYGKKYKIIKICNKVPSEYKKIDGFNWFLGGF